MKISSVYLIFVISNFISSIKFIPTQINDMQTFPPNTAQAGYSTRGHTSQSFYPGQSQYDSRGYPSQYMNPQAGYNPNYQPYYNQWNRNTRPPYYGEFRGSQVQLQRENSNPSYQYTNNPQSINPNTRINQRVQYFNSPTQYKNTTGTLPHQIPTRIQPKPTSPSPNVPVIQQVIYQQQPLNIPQSVRNVQYIPHLNRYMDYVEQRVKVPVQKYLTDYYEVEHVTEFVPREYEESVVEMVPEEIVRYRLEYVPVQRKIVHMPKGQVYDENGLFKGVGNLADRQQASQEFIRQPNETSQRTSNQLFQNRGTSQLRGLDQSLVDAIGKDIQNKTETLINKQLYQGLNKELNSPQYQASRVKGSSNLLTRYDGMTGYSQEQINQALYTNINRPTQNQYIDAQMYAGQSRTSSQQRSRVSRKRTNFVTSDGYFPNYDGEMRDLGASY